MLGESLDLREQKGTPPTLLNNVMNGIGRLKPQNLLDSNEQSSKLLDIVISRILPSFSSTSFKKEKDS